MVVVKDMSRFGRDYLQVGMYTEVLFPEKDIHFVATTVMLIAKRATMFYTTSESVQ